MFNLLPDNLKSEIRAEYKLHKFILILTFIIFIQVSFLVFLFPSWLISLYRENEVSAQIEEINKSPVAINANSISSIIKSTNTKLKIINTALEYPRLIPYVDTIISKKTDNIHLIGIMFSTTAKDTATISIEGLSSTREALVSFVKNLESAGKFKKVDLPVSNLAKDKDIKFSMTLTVAP
jgi:hypothetical protein